MTFCKYVSIQLVVSKFIFERDSGKMLYRVLCIVFFFTATISARSQTASDSALAVVEQLFASMKQADTAKMRPLFAADAIMQTIADQKEDGSVVKGSTVEQFHQSVGKLQPGDADEQISKPVVLIDGALATVWAPYRFFFKGVFSHCGVNCFQLVRMQAGWKIQYLIDTRRKAPCN